MQGKLKKLAQTLKGELLYDKTIRTLYATDASAYRELPLAVAVPETKDDIQKLIRFANEEKTSLIPRTAGTSLAGQVVGDGIVVDVSQKFTKILEVNKEESWVRLQPGVVRDELNMHLKEHGLFFGPETSTANRAMIGGMVGNNSCGSNSIVYGSTRDHLMEVTAFLSDGSEVIFNTLTNEEFESKCTNNKESLESKLYQSIKESLSDAKAQEEIEKEFPKKNIPRRNTGYAIDLLAETAPFKSDGEDFNFCKLIAGSEGTLAFITEIKLHVDSLPPKHKGLVCIHCKTIDESLRANLVAIKYNPSACELMDHYILECTKANIQQRQNRFFVEGDPGAILVVEISRHEEEELNKTAEKLIEELKSVSLGYHYPFITGSDIKKVWDLRKAGLGLLAIMPGDEQAVPVIEDTAVDVQDLPKYIAEFNEILKKYDLYSVHYAHAGSGELHLRPILDLKTEKGNKMFRTIAEEIAALVKKYKGSLSGEHGDGRLRGEFIKYMIGEKNYKLVESIKNTWDPNHIFNPGKIVNTPSMNTSLRYTPGQKNKAIDTLLDFGDEGITRATERCNGSADCRKSHLSGGTMCPSYMATKNEKDTTRARANILREMLTHSSKNNPFDHEEIKEVMDLCLSCKGCKSECPSNVDVGKFKAEFLQHYYEANGIPFRAKLIGNFTKGSKLASIAPWAYNFLFTSSLTSGIAKSIAGFATKRSMPLLHSTTVKKWYKKNKNKNFGVEKVAESKGKVLFFCDEFTDYNDTPIGITAIKLLTKLGYEVEIPQHEESGRSFMSKGLLKEAKKIAQKNISLLKDKVSESTPLVGIEPSAILSFRDEYIDLTRGEEKDNAEKISTNTYFIDEFIAKEIDKGRLLSDVFTDEKQLIKVHGHCHQKSLSSLTHTKKMLSLPKNFEVHMIPSGCCGMAGSFGYEKEHYDISMQVGELVLLPTVRKQPKEVIIAAPGTSCRHQIKDGTGRKALHTVEVLWNALK